MVISWETVTACTRGGTSTAYPDGEIAAVNVAARVGESLSTLRTWDRDHGIGPYHAPPMQRGYTEADLLRVGLMSRTTARGVPPADAARVVLTMNPEQLQAQMDGSPHTGTDGTLGGRNSPGFVLRRVKVIVAAAAKMDVRTLSDLYAETLEKYGLVTAWTHVLVPSLRRIGQAWEKGVLGVESEHLASHLLSSELTLYNRRHRVETTAPITVLLASAEGDLHSLPLQVVEAQLAQSGVRCISLGADVPACALTNAVTRHRPHHVLLWASLPRPESDPIWQHLSAAEHTTHIVTAGPGWGQTAEENRDAPPACRWVDHADGLHQALHLLTVPGLVGYEPHRWMPQ